MNKITATMGDRYKFLGQPDSRFPFLRTGKIYRLVVTEASWDIWDYLKGIKHPEIVLPFSCAYQSRETFNKNWKKWGK